MIASFSAQINSAEYIFIKELNDYIMKLLPYNDFNWSPLMNEDDGSIQVHLPLNSTGLPFLPCFRYGTNERCSVHHIKQGELIKIALSIGSIFGVDAIEKKNKSGKTP